MQTFVRETMRIQAIPTDELNGILMSYEAKHQIEDPSSKGKKVIASTSNHGDAGEPTTSYDDDEDMAPFTRRFKSITRKGSNYKGKRQAKYSNEKKHHKAKDGSKLKEVVYCKCQKPGHIKTNYPLQKKKTGKFEKKKRTLNA